MLLHASAASASTFNQVHSIRHTALTHGQRNTFAFSGGLSEDGSYDLRDRDEAIMTFLFLVALARNKDLEVNVDALLWFATWCNRNKHQMQPNKIKSWVTRSNDLVKLSKDLASQDFTIELYSQEVGDPAALIFSGALALLQYYKIMIKTRPCSQVLESVIDVFREVCVVVAASV